MKIQVGDICYCQQKKLGLVTEVKHVGFNRPLYIGIHLENTDMTRVGHKWQSVSPEKITDITQIKNAHQ